MSARDAGRAERNRPTGDGMTRCMRMVAVVVAVVVVVVVVFVVFLDFLLVEDAADRPLVTLTAPGEDGEGQ